MAIRECSLIVKIIIIVFLFNMLFFFLLLLHVGVFVFQLREGDDGVLEEFSGRSRILKTSSLSFGNSITILQGGIKSVRVSKPRA